MKLENEKAGTMKEVIQWIAAIIFAVLLALLIRGFIFEPVIVQGESMENTLFTGEKLLVYKLGYYFNQPEKGDIIVLQYQEGVINNIPYLKNMPFVRKVFPAIKEVDYIKRVIAVSGDTVDVKAGDVYVNGNKLTEPYVKGYTGSRAMEFPCKVPPNSVLVLGDNRENSRDSREIGFIEFDRIKGKAVFRLWPFKSFGTLK
jgi:signal peptidase I